MAAAAGTVNANEEERKLQSLVAQLQAAHVGSDPQLETLDQAQRAQLQQLAAVGEPLGFKDQRLLLKYLKVSAQPAARGATRPPPVH
jgi:hypothetical protein